MINNILNRLFILIFLITERNKTLTNKKNHSAKSLFGIIYSNKLYHMFRNLTHLYLIISRTFQTVLSRTCNIIVRFDVWTAFSVGVFSFGNAAIFIIYDFTSKLLDILQDGKVSFKFNLISLSPFFVEFIVESPVLLLKNTFYSFRIRMGTSPV